MSPLPFEALTSGPCQGSKQLVVGDALLRRFGLVYDPDPLLDYIGAHNEATFATSRTKRHRLGLEKVFSEVSLASLSWMARNISMHASATRVDVGGSANLLDFTTNFDTIHSPHIGAVFPIMTARTSEYQDMIEAGIMLIRQRNLEADPGKLSTQIGALMRETGTDDGWLEDFEKVRNTKVSLERFERRMRSKAYQMLEENLTIWNYATTPSDEELDDSVFRSKVIYTLARGDVFGPKQSEWFLQVVDPPPPLHQSEGEVVMLVEDFLELRPGDAVHESPAANERLRVLHIIAGNGTLAGVDDVHEATEAHLEWLSLGMEVRFMDVALVEE